ncbi:MAG: hypothetical protein ABIO35_08420 [Nitrobacter sp.]
MPKFRKKPVEINAILWDGDMKTIEPLIALGVTCKAFGQELIGDDLTIETLEGNMTASKGDWIIRGIKGELYPCKTDIFTATYDAVCFKMCHLPNIAKCPLYIESHVPNGLGCVDDLARDCKVERGEMNFELAVLDLASRGIAHPGMLEALNPPSSRAH